MRLNFSIKLRSGTAHCAIDASNPSRVAYDQTKSRISYLKFPSCDRSSSSPSSYHTLERRNSCFSLSCPSIGTAGSLSFKFAVYDRCSVICNSILDTVGITSTLSPSSTLILIMKSVVYTAQLCTKISFNRCDFTMGDCSKM